MIENLFVFYFPTEKLYVFFICDEEDYFSEIVFLLSLFKIFFRQIHTLTVRKIPNKKVLPSLKGTTTLFKTRFKYYASAKSSAT